MSLLPMFMENAHSLAMIAHSMKEIKSAVRHVNPSQIPVIAVDQPLFALAKQIQWTFGAMYYEDQFVVMLGGLHIEMAAFKMLRKWLNGSGWTEALCNAGVATQGVADSFLSTSHLTRTRRAHQVTAASLYILMNKAYEHHRGNVGENDQAKSFQEWKGKMSRKVPQFLFSARVLDLQICTPDGLLCITEICVIFHSSIHTQFSNEAFVVHKTERLFSSIALDHAHEQVNGEVKDQRGAVGLTENPAALRRWMISGPKSARMVEEFEGEISTAETQGYH